MKTPMLSLLAMFLIVSPTGVVRGAPGDLDATFDAGSTVDRVASVLALQADGKVIIGGYFRMVHAQMYPGLARLNADGSTDTSFVPATIPDAPNIHAVIIQTDGRIVVGGSKRTNNADYAYLARLYPDGSLDSAFQPHLPSGADSSISALAIQADGKILVAARINSRIEPQHPVVYRLNPDGTIDTTFLVPAEPSQSVNSLAVQADGRIVIGGSFVRIGGISRTNLARLNTDGSLDSSFMDGMTGVNNPVQCVKIQSDGKIVIGGMYFQTVNGVERRDVARLHPDGSVDESFVSEVHGQGAVFVTGITLQPDGKILLSGALSWTNGPFQVPIVRLEADGTRDVSFSSELEGDDLGIMSVCLKSNGQLIVSGGLYGVYLHQLNQDGSIDPGFSNGPTGPDNEVSEIARQMDGKLLICGSFYRINGYRRLGLARLFADGTFDDSYQSTATGTDGSVYTIAIQGDGKCLVGGTFKTINHVFRPGLVRLNEDGSVDESFLTGLTGPAGLGAYVYALGVQSDGKILASGSFNTFNGVSKPGLVRINSDGSLDALFQGGGSGARVFAFQTDNKILMGGNVAKGLTRLNPDGSVDPAFLNGMAGLKNGSAYCLAIQPDGKVLIGGDFDTVNNVPRFGVARLHPDGALDFSFSGLSERSSIYTVALQPDGKVIVGGRIGSYPNPVRYTARLLSDGRLDPAFGIDQNPNDEVYAALIQPDTKIVIAGRFTAVGQVPQSRVARLLGDMESPVILSPPQSQTVELGSTAHFRVQAEGSSPLTYLWYFNDADCLGATTNCTWHLPEVPFARAGNYSVIVTNLGGAATSAPATLGVIQAVERRMVPGLKLTGPSGSLLDLEHSAGVDSELGWVSLTTVPMGSSPQWCFDLTFPLPPQRFYRARESGNSGVASALGLDFVPTLTVTGNLGDAVQIEGINAVGPVDAWFPLDTVILTNTSQYYFDVGVLGQPPRLYRLISNP